MHNILFSSLPRSLSLSHKLWDVCWLTIIRNDTNNIFPCSGGSFWAIQWWQQVSTDHAPLSVYRYDFLSHQCWRIFFFFLSIQVRKNGRPGMKDNARSYLEITLTPTLTWAAVTKCSRRTFWSHKMNTERKFYWMASTVRFRIRETIGRTNGLTPVHS